MRVIDHPDDFSGLEGVVEIVKVGT